MAIQTLKLNEIETAFKAFYGKMMGSPHFRVFFKDETQIEYLIKVQAKNFHQSLSMAEPDFQKNYIELGQMHAQLKLPLEDLIAGLALIRDNLSKYTHIDENVLYKMVEHMEQFLAKGYLIAQFQETKVLLDYTQESIKSNYLVEDAQIIARPLIWLEDIIQQLQTIDSITEEDICPASSCPLSPLIEDLMIESQLKAQLMSVHQEQHSLGQSFAYFYQQKDYTLAHFLFTKLHSVTLSLSQQMGLGISHQAVEHLQYDALTGLLLRHSLPLKLKEACQKSFVVKEKLALMMLDLDHFKKVNDSWGHPAGDLVLESLGALITQNQRRDDLAFRYGGEEFLMVLSHIEEATAFKVAERLRKQVANLEIEWEGQPISLTLSIGCLVVNYEDLNTQFEKLIEQADTNLYQAKDFGRNQVVLTHYQAL